MAASEITNFISTRYGYTVRYDVSWYELRVTTGDNQFY